jgi:hypothetical protein
MSRDNALQSMSRPDFLDMTNLERREAMPDSRPADYQIDEIVALSDGAKSRTAFAQRRLRVGNGTAVVLHPCSF